MHFLALFTGIAALIGPTTAVPEIDGSLAVSAVAFLTGAITVARSRRRN